MALLRLDILGRPLLLLLLLLVLRILLPFLSSASSLYISLSTSGSLCHILPSLLAVCTTVRCGYFLWSRRRCLSMKTKKGGRARLDLKRTLFPKGLPLLAWSLGRVPRRLLSMPRGGLWMVIRNSMVVLAPRLERTGRAMAAAAAAPPLREGSAAQEREAVLPSALAAGAH